MPIDVPTFRIELNDIRYCMLRAISNRNEELVKLIDNAIDLALKTLPEKIIRVVQEAMVRGVEMAAEKAVEEYYSPGGQGYESILAKLQEGLCQKK